MNSVFWRTFLSVGLAIGLCGCGSITLKTSTNASKKPTYSEYFDIWGVGFGGEGVSSLEGACPNNRIAKIRSYYSLEDILLGTLTSGIYTPRTVNIFCSEDTVARKN